MANLLFLDCRGPVISPGQRPASSGAGLWLRPLPAALARDPGPGFPTALHQRPGDTHQTPGGRSTNIGYFRTSNWPRHLDFHAYSASYCIFMTKGGPQHSSLREPTWEDATGPASFITDSQNRPFSSGERILMRDFC